MARMVVIYRTPQDPQAFEEHYFKVHVPLAKQLQGLIKYETSVGPVVAMAGAKDAFLVGILYFESMAAIKTAFASELGKACAADRRILAPTDDDVQMFLFEDQTV